MLITRRRLPHHYEIGVPLFVTFHLAGALPPGRYPRPGVENARAAFVWMDRMLDHATRGPRWLVEEGVAEAVARVLEETRDEYELRAWVLMPNHAHLLAVPRIDPAKMMQEGTVSKHLQHNTQHNTTQHNTTRNRVKAPTSIVSRVLRRAAAAVVDLVG